MESVNKMKKSIYVLLLMMMILLLTGCNKKEEEMTSFIPTQAPTEDGGTVDNDTVDGDEAQTDQEEVTEAASTPSVVHVGQTKPMYVKMDEYGATLNVRATPSTNGEAVGFLVHGEKIEVADIADGWASFVYNDALCYVNADFLVDKQPEYLEPPTPTPTPKVTPTKDAPKPEI
jgi:hypothetical protein